MTNAEKDHLAFIFYIYIYIRQRTIPDVIGIALEVLLLLSDFRSFKVFLSTFLFILLFLGQSCSVIIVEE